MELPWVLGMTGKASHVALLGLALALGPAVARAQVVTSLLDDGSDGTLRREIADSPAGGTVTFRGDVTGTIFLGSQIVIDRALTLTGPGADRVTVSGNGNVGVFVASPATGTVALSRLTVTQGLSGTDGGCIDVTSGVVEVDHLRVVSCGATNQSAVRVAIGASLSLVATEVSDSFGTGVLVTSPGVLTASLSTFANNVGRGVWVTGGGPTSPPRFSYCTFYGNGGYGIDTSYALAVGILTGPAPNAARFSSAAGSGYCWLDGFSGTSIASTANVDGQVVPLAFNGGATRTVAFQATSPAVGFGAKVAGEPTVDQRGVPRPNNPDPGAFQSPWISHFADLQAIVGVPLGVPFVAGTLDATVTASSGDPSLVSALSVNGTGSNRTLDLTPAKVGAATITVEFSELGFHPTSSFTLNVTEGDAGTGGAAGSGAGGDAGIDGGGGTSTGGAGGSSGVTGSGGSSAASSGGSGGSGGAGASDSGQGGASGTGPEVTGTFSSCVRDSECASGFCVEGVCCDARCDQPCHTCVLPSVPGRCVLSPTGVDLRQDCGSNLSCVSTCGPAGACIGAGETTTCARSRCVDSVRGVGAAYCSAANGSCRDQDVVPFDCSPYTCAPAFGACVSQCSSTSECAAGFFCSGTACVEQSATAPADRGGCGCSLPGVPSRAKPWWPFAIAAALVLGRRKVQLLHTPRPRARRAFDAVAHLSDAVPRADHDRQGAT